MWFPSVGQQDDNDDEEEQPSSSCDAEDGRKSEKAVGPDVNFSWRDVKSSYLDLKNIINNADVSTVFQNSVENPKATKNTTNEKAGLNSKHCCWSIELAHTVQ